VQTLTHQGTERNIENIQVNGSSYGIFIAIFQAEG
jgi:hypothetical protein